MTSTHARTILCAVITVLALAACGETGAPDIEIGSARAAEPAGGSSQIVVEIANHGDGADTLVGARTPAAAALEIHRTEVEDGRAEMRQLEEVEVLPGETLQFRPGALHLMLVLPDETVEQGGTFPVVLHFDRSGERSVEVHVVGYEDLVDDAVPE